MPQEQNLAENPNNNNAGIKLNGREASASKEDHAELQQSLTTPTTLSPFLFISTVPEPVNPCDLESTGLYGFRSCGFGCIGRSMADEIPIIPKVNVLEVRTGNIVNWNRLKRKPNHTPTLEVNTSGVS